MCVIMDALSRSTLLSDTHVLVCCQNQAVLEANLDMHTKLLAGMRTADPHNLPYMQHMRAAAAHTMPS